MPVMRWPGHWLQINCWSTLLSFSFFTFLRGEQIEGWHRQRLKKYVYIYISAQIKKTAPSKFIMGTKRWMRPEFIHVNLTSDVEPAQKKTFSNNNFKISQQMMKQYKVTLNPNEGSSAVLWLCKVVPSVRTEEVSLSWRFLCNDLSCFCLGEWSWNVSVLRWTLSW